MADRRRSQRIAIDPLLAAEQEAQHIVNGARNARLARLNQAKEEAHREISEYRAQLELDLQSSVAENTSSFQSSGNSGADTNQLEQDTVAKIDQLKMEAARVSQDVVNLLLKQVMTVKK